MTQIVYFEKQTMWAGYKCFSSKVSEFISARQRFTFMSKCYQCIYPHSKKYGSVTSPSVVSIIVMEPSKNLLEVRAWPTAIIEAWFTSYSPMTSETASQISAKLAWLKPADRLCVIVEIAGLGQYDCFQTSSRLHAATRLKSARVHVEIQSFS